MHESELLFQVSQIVSRTNSFTRAVEKIRILLEQVLGARALTVIGASDMTGNASPEETRFQSWKAAPLRAGGRELGKLLVSSDVPHRVSNYTGEQLGMLLERTRLAKERVRLEAALASLQADLATRKLVQRAEGILVTRRGMTPASAKLWISQRARQGRLSVQQVAEQVVVTDNKQREPLFTQSRRRRIA
jgi:transcriptional regulator with GAF, ATPase, and Fis domain